MLKGLFKKPKNPLERTRSPQKAEAVVAAEETPLCCDKCRKPYFAAAAVQSGCICPSCGAYFRMSARERIGHLTDAGSFEEHDCTLKTRNLLDFPSYDTRLETAREQSGEEESVVCGAAAIGGEPCALFVMEHRFMMGSMGTVTGEKITALFEYALKQGLPVVGCTVSGGARMQEGILSLMQMAKTSGAVKRHSDAGLLYIALLTDPTTGGVTASFAMEADIILAEPGALIAFAGPRVIEQAMRKKLPPGFQRAEFLQEKGFVDRICSREEQKNLITSLLAMHGRKAAGL